MLAGVKKILYLVPAECPGCNKRTGKQKLCPECTVSLKNIDKRQRCAICKQVLQSGFCHSCSGQQIYFDRVVSVFDYKGLGQQLIHDYKIHNRLSLSGLLSDLLVDTVLNDKQYVMPDILLAVPAHTGSVAERGFSPAGELARLTAKRLKINYHLDLLWRIKESAKQSTLNYQQRQTAQLFSYACDQLRLKNKNVVVIDDVMTTGATLNAIANILKQAGASSVHCWVLARTLR